MYNGRAATPKRRPLIIARYIRGEVIRPFVAGLGLLALIFAGYSATVHLDLAAQGRLPLASALRLIALNTLVTLEILMPSTLFFAVLAALGRMHRDAEMTVLRASGIGQNQILAAVFGLSLAVALLTSLVSIEGRPWAYREMYRIEAEALAEFDLRKIATGKFVGMGDSDYVFIAGGLDLARGVHENVFMHRGRPGERYTELIVAREASLPALNPGSALSASFRDGYHYLLDWRGSRDVTVRFGQLALELEGGQAHSAYRRKAETTARLGDSRAPKDIAEYQWRLSTPLATLLLALVAVPLARSEPRQPRFRGFLAAIAVYVALFGLTSVTRTFVEQGRIGAFPGIWAAYGLMFLALLALLRRPPGPRR